MKKNRIAAAALCAVIAGSGIFALGTPVYADWTKENGSTYYTDTQGQKATGFKEIDGNRYYFGKDGKMRKNWAVIGSKIYYFGSDGKMRTGKVTISDKNYEFSSKGALKIDQGIKGFSWSTTQQDLQKNAGKSALGFGPMIFTGTEYSSTVYMFDSKGKPFICFKALDNPKGISYFKKALKKEGFKYTGKENIDGTTAYIYKKGGNIALVAEEGGHSTAIYLSPELSLVCASKGFDSLQAEMEKYLAEFDWESALSGVDLSNVDLSGVNINMPKF